MPKTPIVEFHFQEIPLDEAVNAVMAGDGNYAIIKAKLLETLPNLPAEKAFAFGLPNGKEVEEDQRRGVCLALNTTLKKVNLSWRVTYSSMKKLFICVPRATRTYEKTKREKIKGQSNGVSQSLPIDDFIKMARDILNFHEPFRNGSMHRACVKFRAAVSIVGQRDMHFSGTKMDNALGFKNGGANYYANNPGIADPADLKELRRVLNLEGGK